MPSAHKSKPRTVAVKVCLPTALLGAKYDTPKRALRQLNRLFRTAYNQSFTAYIRTHIVDVKHDVGKVLRLTGALRTQREASHAVYGLAAIRTAAR